MDALFIHTESTVGARSAQVFGKTCTGEVITSLVDLNRRPAARQPRA
jgi:hypothetical protein